MLVNAEEENKIQYRTLEMCPWILLVHQLVLELAKYNFNSNTLKLNKEGKQTSCEGQSKMKRVSAGYHLLSCSWPCDLANPETFRLISTAVNPHCCKDETVGTSPKDQTHAHKSQHALIVFRSSDRTDKHSLGGNVTASQFTHFHY